MLQFFILKMTKSRMPLHSRSFRRVDRSMNCCQTLMCTNIVEFPLKRAETNLIPCDCIMKNTSFRGEDDTTIWDWHNLEIDSKLVGKEGTNKTSSIGDVWICPLPKAGVLLPSANDIQIGLRNGVYVENKRQSPVIWSVQPESTNQLVIQICHKQSYLQKHRKLRV